jgi:hypothetical protein
MKRNVELHTVNGTVVKGDRYLFPGNERHPIIITKPSGNKGAATKQNHVAWDEISGSAIYMEPPKVYKDKPSAQHVIDVVSNQFNSGFGNKLDGHDSRIQIKAPVQETANPSHDTTDVSKKGENVDTAKPDSFVSAPDGSKDFGEITPEIAIIIGRESAKIRLRQGDSKDGLTHIEQHESDIKALGFESVKDFISEITHNFTAIYKREKSNSRSLMLVDNSGKLKYASIQLELSEDGSFYETKMQRLEEMTSLRIKSRFGSATGQSRHLMNRPP